MVGPMRCENFAGSMGRQRRTISLKLHPTSQKRNTRPAKQDKAPMWDNAARLNGTLSAPSHNLSKQTERVHWEADCALWVWGACTCRKTTGRTQTHNFSQQTHGPMESLAGHTSHSTLFSGRRRSVPCLHTHHIVST